MPVIHSENELTAFLNEKTGLTSFQLTPLKQEVSHREYYRLHFFGGATTDHARKLFQYLNLSVAPQNTNPAFVISVNHDKLNTDDDFCIIQNELKKHSVPVPEIYRVDHEYGLIWQEDLGDADLGDMVQDKTKEMPAPIENFYKQSVQSLVRLKTMKATPPVINRFFDYEKFMFELSYLGENAGKHLSEKELSLTNGVYGEWKNLCQYLDQFKDERICHRDFHCRNIKIKDNSIRLIDFQDARMGCRYYDLASLLYDPYAGLTENFKNKLFTYYHDQTGEKEDTRAYQAQAIQRLLKALGTYIHQTHEKKKTSHAGFIIPTLQKLEGLLVQNREMPETRRWVKSFYEILSKK